MLHLFHKSCTWLFLFLCIFIISICLYGCASENGIASTEKPVECIVIQTLYREGRWRNIYTATFYVDHSYTWKTGKYFEDKPVVKEGILPDDLFEQIKEAKDKHEGNVWKGYIFTSGLDDSMDPMPDSIRNVIRFIRSSN
jgi:hypothetical protein